MCVHCAAALPEITSGVIGHGIAINLDGIA